ncbi:hypothetical protein L204_101001 [Cryptococcus depauperatus]
MIKTMPLNLSHIIHRRSQSSTEKLQVERDESDASTPRQDASPRSQPASFKDQRRLSARSGSEIQDTQKNSASPSLMSSEHTGNSTNGSALTQMHKRLSNLTLDRSDTIESLALDTDTDKEHNNGSCSPSTPGTSASSIPQYCPLPSTASQRFPFFMMTLSSISTLSFIALPLRLRSNVLDAVNRAWKKGVGKIREVEYQNELMKRHKERGCEGGVWEVTLRGEAWVPSNSEQVSSKRIIINLLTVFAKEGYDLCSSYRTSCKDTSKDTLTFLRSSLPPDPHPVFFAVAFYSSDRIFIIDAEAEVGQAIEEGIKSWWVDGVKDARVRERHCRELRLRGTPWTTHGTHSLISARCIHLTIMKTITNSAMGYDFVGSVDTADRQEGEMPVMFYRKQYGPSTKAVWRISETTDNHGKS